MHLITGASASGKSAYAEDEAIKLGEKRYYIATMHNDGTKELQERIQKHRKMRENKGFQTIEQEQDIAKAQVDFESSVLVECLSNLLANEIYLGKHTPEDAVDKIFDDIVDLAKRCKNIIIVTNEVFSDGIVYFDETRKYIDALASLNCRLAMIAGTVTEIVYSIPIVIRGN